MHYPNANALTFGSHAPNISHVCKYTKLKKYLKVKILLVPRIWDKGDLSCA